MTGFYWLVSYPKSGSTWLSLALGSMYRDGMPVDFATEAMGFPQAAARDVFDSVLHIESSDLTHDEDERLRPRLYELLAAEARTPMLRRVHSAFVPTGNGEPLFPPQLTLGVIYLTRDPRDVAVSYAHYMDSTIDAAIESMRNPFASIGAKHGTVSHLLTQRLLTWSDHVQSWLRAGLPLLQIRYEDMLESPAEALSSVASFLGWNTDPGVIAAAVETTRFDRLQSQEQEHGFQSGSGRSRPFFRRGVAGAWRDSLNAPQVRLIERDHGQVMTRLGYALTEGISVHFP